MVGVGSGKGRSPVTALYDNMVNGIIMPATNLRGSDHDTRLEAKVYGSCQYCDFPLILGY